MGFPTSSQFFFKNRLNNGNQKLAHKQTLIIVVERVGSGEVRSDGDTGLLVVTSSTVGEAVAHLALLDALTGARAYKLTRTAPV